MYIYAGSQVENFQFDLLGGFISEATSKYCLKWTCSDRSASTRSMGCWTFSEKMDKNMSVTNARLRHP